MAIKKSKILESITKIQEENKNLQHIIDLIEQYETENEFNKRLRCELNKLLMRIKL